MTKSSLDKTDHDKITEIHSILLGTNGNPGLCKLVDRNTKAINKIWIAITLIAASAGGGYIAVIQALAGRLTGG